MGNKVQDNLTIVWVEDKTTEINSSIEMKEMENIQIWYKAFRAKVIRAYRIINNTSNFKRNINDERATLMEAHRFYKVHNIEAHIELLEILEVLVQDK